MLPVKSGAPAFRLVLALAWLCASPLAAETWYESYHKAEEALAKERWSEAVGHLNAALGERPNSGANVRTYGMRFVQYFPYLKLGIAYYHLGQADAALQAFETEERQAEIGQSGAGWAELREYRGRIERTRAQEKADRERRAQAVLVENLAAARGLETQGRREDALAALSRVLAVAPDHPEAQAARRRILAALSAEARTLRQPKEGERAADPLGGLGRTAQTPGGRPTAQTQAPKIAEPQASEPRTPVAQAIAEESAAQAAVVPRFLAEAEQHYAAGSYEQALRSANRVLVLEPTNDAALRQITRAYARLSDALLSPDRTPPAILLDDAPSAGAAGPAVVTVRSARLVLSGTVYDSAPVEVRFFVAGRPAAAPTIQVRELEGVRITAFRWQQVLPAGESEIEIVAVDVSGNRAAVLYRVEYVVPFLRTLGFPLALVATLAAAVGAWLLSRIRRRRRLLRDRFNPYVAGAPILEQARFFGRQSLLDYVLRRVSNNSIMLYGERRIGKTSFQHRLKRHLAALEDPVYVYHPVFIDLQGTLEEKFFATLAAEIFHELSPKLGGMQPLSPPGEASYGYSELVKDLQRVLKALQDRTKKRVKLVLQIDEVDELNQYDPRVNQRLRSLFMRTFADSLVAVVSGVAIKKQWEREGSPWYNFFQEIEVKPLDPDEARSLVASPLRGVFTLDDGVADEIIRRTGCKPYLIQRLCSGLVDRMHQERRRRITEADVAVACQAEGL